eukprot:414510-Prorocentrum_minimum.AAC.5
MVVIKQFLVLCVVSSRNSLPPTTTLKEGSRCVHFTLTLRHVMISCGNNALQNHLVNAVAHFHAERSKSTTPSVTCLTCSPQRQFEGDASIPPIPIVFTMLGPESYFAWTQISPPRSRLLSFSSSFRPETLTHN